MNRHSHQHGFTLLELLASLALMGLLMLGVWSGIRTTSHAASHGRARVDQLDRIRGAEKFLRKNLTQASPIPWSTRTQDHATVFSGEPHAMHFVAPLPGFLGRMGPQLQTLELVPNGDGSWRLQISFALLPPDGSQPKPFGKPEILLENIAEGKFLYRGRDLQLRDSGWNDTWEHPGSLPSLVQIQLQLSNGSWPTLTAALPIDSSAVNRAAIRASAWRSGQP